MTTEVVHAAGVAWHQAPVPRRWHRCRPQSWGWVGFTFYERCACGAGRLDRQSPWLRRNTRRKERP